LQPLPENAIRHGIAGFSETGARLGTDKETWQSQGLSCPCWDHRIKVSGRGLQRGMEARQHTIRVLIIDDEPLARTALENVLAARSEVEFFDSASNAFEALDKLGKCSYDVLLLDVNMPEVSGIELLGRLKENNLPMPSIVFVTAHAEHAITAFENHALDYVLKPFSSERIGEALDIAFRRTAAERAARPASTIPSLQKLTERQSARIAIKSKGRILFVDPDDVIAVQAEGNYVLLQRLVGSYLLRESISVMEEKLKPYGFIRIHRSVLVNAALVEEIQPWATGEYALRVKGGKEYTVTRTYKKNLANIAASWIGTDNFIDK
jgi:two-component system, LytTR family, response regulator